MKKFFRELAFFCNNFSHPHFSLRHPCASRGLVSVFIPYISSVLRTRIWIPDVDVQRKRLRLGDDGGGIRHHRGFTLIELSIVLAIVSVMVASALGAYKVIIVKEYRDTTLKRMDIIRDAMVKFQNLPATVNPNKRLPCPAPLYADPTSNANFGVEDVAPNGNCSYNDPPTNNTPATLNGTIRAPDAALAAIPAPSTVRIGAVPWRTLGLSAEIAHDSWGHPFLY